MNEKEADRILDTANFLLRWFPNELPNFQSRKNFKRKSYLRAKHIGNRKVFFDIILRKYNGLNKRDKARRYKIILYLRQILLNEIPQQKDDIYIYKISKKDTIWIVLIKDILRKGRKELYLYSIYPLI